MHFMKPRLSEKAFAQSQATNTFVIDVPAGLNKHEVARTVAKQFEVEVTTVRIVNRPGKVKRVMNLTGKRSSNRTGIQADTRKAYITLAKGSHLPFFQAEETEIAEAAKKAEKKTDDKKVEKKPAAKTPKAEKKADKPAKKETK